MTDKAEINNCKQHWTNDVLKTNFKTTMEDNFKNNWDKISK